MIAAAESADAFSAESLANIPRRLPDTDVNDFVRHIRQDPQLDIATTLKSWQKDRGTVLGKEPPTTVGESCNSVKAADKGWPEGDSSARPSAHHPDSCDQ